MGIGYGFAPDSPGDRYPPTKSDVSRTRAAVWTPNSGTWSLDRCAAVRTREVARPERQAGSSRVTEGATRRDAEVPTDRCRSLSP
jgi:hypothetical protein